MPMPRSKAKLAQRLFQRVMTRLSGSCMRVSDGSSKFIFDLMEPERPRIDRAVLDFVKGHVFDPADFVIRATASAGLVRKWRGLWWRKCRRRKSPTHWKCRSPACDTSFHTICERVSLLIKM